MNSPTLASSSGQQSAALKAHALHHKTLSAAEAERIAKLLDSDSRRSIAPNTSRLYALPQSDIQLNERFTVIDGVVVVLDPEASDGDARRAPTAEQQRLKVDSEGRTDQYVKLAEGSETYNHWMRTVGNLVAYHVCGQTIANSKRWRIRLPMGYTLWHHVDGTVSDDPKNARRDPYLYGSTTHGTGKTPFRSPAEFAPHFMWLMLGRPQGECRCQYCSHRPQDTVSSELFGYLPKDAEEQERVGSSNGTGTGGKKPQKKRKKDGDKPIVAKDYRQGI
ncbi:unnamed protein product [Peniophora sp. CBMAI 1063]|nr:unnamed protein product [Peniophora sp. CBMAI 1063]